MSFGEGVDTANRMEAGNRAVRNESRQVKQQKLSNLIKGFEEKDGEYRPNARGQAALDLQTEKIQVQLAAAQEQNRMMQSVLNEKSMTAGLGQMAMGKVADGFDEIKRNPILMKTLKSKGIVNMVPVDWANDIELAKTLKGVNITPEKLKDPKVVAALNSAYHKVLDDKGKWHITSTEAILKASNTMSYMNSSDRAGMTSRYNRVMQILKGAQILTPTEQEAKDAMAAAQGATAALNEKTAQLKLEDLENWRSANPNGTMSEYIQSITPVKPISEAQQVKNEKARLGLDAAKNAEANKGTEKEFVDSLKTTDSSKYTQEVYSRAKALESDNKKAGIGLTSSYIQGVYENTNSAKEFLGLVNDIESIKRDGIEKVKKDFLQIFGLNKGLSGTPEEKAKQRRQRVDKLQFETKLGLAVAKYVKFMSGAAVTEQEFNRYNVFSQAGTWSDITAASEALNAFADSLKGTLDEQIDSVRVKHPWTYMNRKTDVEDFMKVTNKRAENPFRKPKSDRKSLDSFGGN